MARLTLNPNPTFKAKVGIPVPGGNADVELVFKYRDRKALGQWIEDTSDVGEVELILDMAEGWDLADAFTAENIERLCNAYPGASREITHRYMRELAGIREKN